LNNFASEKAELFTSLEKIEQIDLGSNKPRGIANIAASLDREYQLKTRDASRKDLSVHLRNQHFSGKSFSPRPFEITYNNYCLKKAKSY